jgi:hypothetical protein
MFSLCVAAAQRREEKVQGKETAGCVPLSFDPKMISDGIIGLDA